MISQSTLNKFAFDPFAYVCAQNVDASGIVKRLGDCIAPFQVETFKEIAPGLLHCSGRKLDPTAKLKMWTERCRGASKTTDIGLLSTWLLMFGVRPMNLFAYATDRDQASILKADVATDLRLNPWKQDVLRIESNRVVNILEGSPAYGSSLSIEASNVASSYGILPDAIIADEVCHWPESGQELFTSILSSVAKRSNALLFCISNSGFMDSWQWNSREIIRDDPAWIFTRMEGRSPWMTEEQIAEQKRLLPPIAFSRLWENLWSSGGGDALTQADINAAFRDDFEPMTGNEPGYLFCAGLDLSTTRDHSAIVVMAGPIHGSGLPNKIRLATHRVYIPTPGERINFLRVERDLRELDQQFNLEFIGGDSFQSENLFQRMEDDMRRGRRNQKRRFGSQPFMREILSTPKNLMVQASLVLQGFADRRFQFYPCPPLRYDLEHLQVTEQKTSGGFRLTSPRSAEHGHGDCFSAAACAIQLVHECIGARPNIAGLHADESGSSMKAMTTDWEQRQKEYQEEMAYLDSEDRHSWNAL